MDPLSHLLLLGLNISKKVIRAGLPAPLVSEHVLVLFCYTHRQISTLVRAPIGLDEEALCVAMPWTNCPLGVLRLSELRKSLPLPFLLTHGSQLGCFCKQGKSTQSP